MAKKTDARTFNISVIGLSGTEREKGSLGVGKSCLCNRFIHQVEDKYHQDHISVLSQSDFAGRVINNDHFLYWGEAIKTDDGNNFTFHVLEQTEFIDDVSFQPFKTGRIDPYHKRCVAMKVQSAEKLMYICKEQLGMETDSAYEQKLMADGKLSTDGFLCCFDVSRHQQRQIEKQVEFVALLLNNAMKTKKPVVLVTTKTEEADDKFLKEVEKLIARREYKGGIPLVESSAHSNVNVELAFMTLAHLIDKTKGRTKIASFAEAKRARDEILKVATEAYKNLLRVQVVDAKSNWHVMKKKLEKEADFGHFIDLYGTDIARKLFREHTKQLRDEQVRRREQHYLTSLPDILQHFLPEVTSILDSWMSCQRYVRRHKDFSQYFVDIGEGLSWKDSDIVDNYEETRLPFDWLNSSEADICYRNHHNALQAEYRKKELKKQFKKLLEDNPQVSPGKTLEETYVFFIGKDCYNNLQEYERQQVYELHQADLKLEAKQQFQELLWEKSVVFTGLSPTARLTQEDLKGISQALHDDPRYKRMDKLEEDRKVVILNHLGFMQCPSKDRCYFKEACVESQAHRVLQEYKNRQSQSEESEYNTINEQKSLNLVLLGNEGLSTELYKEIRECYRGDLFEFEHSVYSLDYRPIEGDVSLEQNAIFTANFRPHGCLCVYYCQTSLDYIHTSLQKLLLADISQEDGQSLQGLPMAVIHAYNPGASDNEFQRLTQQGKDLAKRFQLAFVGVPDDDDLLYKRNKFYPMQLEQALSLIVGTNTLQGGLLLSPMSEPKLRILLCMMCGDPYPIDIPLGPLLNSDSCYISATENAVVIDKHLDFTRQKIVISISSYHGENIQKNVIYHGYILVYSVKRQASLATMRAFASYLPPVPALILAVTDSSVSSAFFSSELGQNLISDGVSIADELSAKIMVTTANFQQQTAVYVPFFKEAWERREQTESYYNDSNPPAYDESLDQRPPAPLPKPYDMYQTTKSSTSNSQSTEDSEPLYDHAIYPGYDQSDSEQERASSASPPQIRSASPSNGHFLNSEVPSENNSELLVRPSMVKSRRAEYAAWAIHEQHQVKRDVLYTNTRQIANEDGEYRDNSLNSSTGSRNSNDDVQWTNNELYWSTHSDAKYKGKPNPLDMRQFEPVVSMMHQSSKAGRKSKVIAPLAEPEPIEIADYGLPKTYRGPQDTVHCPNSDNDYALVDDALPAGQLFRIKSNKVKVAGTTDSEDSEFSSLERDKKAISDKVARRPTPHKKKQRQRQHDANPYAIHVLSDSQQFALHTDSGERVQSNSPSEGSEGTGDEIQLLKTGYKERKRRSFKHRKAEVVPPEMIAVTMSPPMSDSDTFVGSPSSHFLEHHYESVQEYNVYNNPTISGPIDLMDDMDFDLNDSGNWKDKFKIPRSQKDTLRLKKKEEKRQKDDERRRQKEEERKQKEQQKLQKKGKKKDGKSSVTSDGGNRLEDYLMSPSNLSVPHFIERCVEFIELEGLVAEGIYRIPGNKAQVDLLQNKFNEDPNVDINSLDIQVNAVATILKMFFNNLTEPLVPPALYDELIEAAGVQDKSSRLLALRGVLKKLHPLNYEVLKYLITHLHRVGQHADKTSMDSNNLARCWWPTILRMEFTTFEKMTMLLRIPEEVVQMMIEQCGFFFHGENEV